MAPRDDVSSTSGQRGQGDSLGSPLGRYVAILEALSASSVGLTRKDIELILGIPRTTTLRLLDNLIAEGMVRESNRTGTYVPGARMVRILGTDRTWLERDVRPVLRALSVETGATVFLARLIGDRVKAVLRETAPQAEVTLASPGYNFPADTTATGRIMLAHSSPAMRRRIYAALGKHGQERAAVAMFHEIVAQGYARETGEHIPGRSSLAVPVAADSAWPIEFALGLTVPHATITAHETDFLLGPLRKAAARICVGMPRRG
ncbi:IclR family transcriptional regulator [Paracoccus sediminicola]|uniref:IclR family transcriptional regulator n=1 Tax=Paracoccus sediminicola TaxID=3017783 RepID=UPI0022F09DA9|nr:IclR family transcriptional regulator C-terminal domain-containing protein [Paracoccus sediminicola]WBU56623.1 helix-turn-helix domain-containing protein [Paracoccus sediminicola]